MRRTKQGARGGEERDPVPLSGAQEPDEQVPGQRGEAAVQPHGERQQVQEHATGEDRARGADPEKINFFSFL